MIRIGSALFNADHTRLAEEVRRVERAGADFLHLDVFDGYFVPDQAFSARTIKALRRITQLPFEVHLAVNDPLRFLGPLAEAGSNLIFLPAESTPLLYEAIYAVREKGMKVGLCLALGTPLTVLSSTLAMIDAVLLLGRVTGEGKRGRDFNDLVIQRVREVRRSIDAGGHTVDLQAAGGLETAHCVEVCQAGAISLPLGAALHREPDLGAYVSFLRGEIEKGLVSLEARGIEAVQAPLAEAERSRLAGSRSRIGSGPGREDSEKGTGAPWESNVLVASRSFGKNCPEMIEKMKSAGCVFLPHRFDRAPTEDELVSVIGEVEVLISGTEPVTDRVLAAAPRLRVISKHGVGYDNIDLTAAKARGIPVAVAGPAVLDSVADLALGLLLALARKIPQGNANVKSGRWDRFIGPELRDKVLGIVGLGQIGKAVCCRAKGFGMQVVAHDAFPDAAFAASWRVQYLDLDELFSQSDFISLHAPLSASTRQLVGSAQLARMKRTGCLINTARGELVDERALYEALKSNQIAGAATDVFVKEPPGDNPLLSLENFIAMPHCGGQTPEALRRMGEITGENVLRVLAGQEPLYVVEG